MLHLKATEERRGHPLLPPRRRRQPGGGLQMSQTMRFHSERHMRSDAVGFARDLHINSELCHRGKRVSWQHWQKNYRVEAQQLMRLNDQIETAKYLKNIKFLHQAKGGAQPDEIREHRCSRFILLQQQSQLHFRGTKQQRVLEGFLSPCPQPQGP